MLSSFGDGGLQQSCWQISSQQSCPQPCHLPGQTQATHMRSGSCSLGWEVRAAFRGARRCLDVG